MNHEETIRKFFASMKTHDGETIFKMFTPNATVIHPIFGERPATEIFKRLFQEVTLSRLDFHNTLIDPKHPNRAAVYLTGEAIHTKQGAHLHIPHGIFIFDFAKSGLIEKIIVIFDTYKIRDFVSERAG